MAEFEERGWQNVKIVLPIQTIFSSQVVLDGEGVTEAQPDEVLFLPAQLTSGGGGGELDLAFQVFRNGRFSRGKGNTDPNKPAKVSDLRRR